MSMNAKTDVRVAPFVWAAGNAQRGRGIRGLSTAAA